MQPPPILSEIVRPAVMESLSELLQWVHTQIQSSNLSSKAAYQLEVALEEAIVNVIQHAYPQGHGTIALAMHFYPQEKIEFTLVDQGVPFNPLNTPHVHPDLEDEVPIGGLGIPFLISFVDNAHYERIEPSNILRLVKHLP